MRFLIVAALFSIFSVAPAAAQSTCPYIATGAVLTAAQWNSCFAAKQNTFGYTPVNKAGDVMLGFLGTTAATTNSSGFRLPQGTAPTAPVNGDIWTTSAGLFVRINGATVGPIVGSSSGSAAGTLLQGTGSSTAAIWTSTPTLGIPGSVAGSLSFANLTSGTITLSPPSGALGSVILTLPDVTDMLVARTTTDTLSNKTLASPAFTGTLTGGTTGAGLTLNFTDSTLAGLIPGVNGGTGVANSGKTITLGGNLTTSGTFNLIATLTGNTNVTFPTSGLLATTGGANIPSLVQGDMLYASAVNTLTALAKDTGTSRFIKNSGTNNNPQWAQPAASDLSNGTTGTGAVALAQQPTFVAGASATTALNWQAFGSTSSDYVGVNMTAANASLVGSLWARADGGLLYLTGLTSTCLATGSGGITGGTPGFCLGSNQTATIHKHVKIGTSNAPALTACGTSPTISGSDFKGVITQGTGATGCTVTFNVPNATFSTCSVTSRSALQFTYTPSATALTITNIGLLSSTLLDYTCAGD